MHKSSALLALAASLAAAAPSGASTISTPVSSDMPACTTSIESIISAFPTPKDDALPSYFQSVLAGDMSMDPNPTNSDMPNFCAITSVPAGPVQTAYASFTSAILSWSSAQADAIKEFQSKCQDSGDAAGEMEQVLTAASLYVGEGCPGATVQPNTASATAAPTGSPSGSGSASGAATSPTSTKAPNAGARATGAAAAGVLALAAAVVMI